MSPLSSVGPRAWRALVSALAGGGLTAVALAPLTGGAIAAEPPPEKPSPPTGATGEPAPPPVEPPSPPTEQPTQTTPQTTTSTPTPLPLDPTPPPQSAPAPSTQSTQSTPAPSTQSTPAAPAAPRKPAAEVPTVVVQRRQKTTVAKRQNATSTSPQGAAKMSPPKAGKLPASPAGSVPNNVALAPGLIAVETGALAAELAATAASDQALAFYRIPLFLLPIYQAAAVSYDVPWQILAAINEIETNYGNNTSVSSAGAVGWMQFMPQTWIQYGVDALNSGYADPYNPVDAVFAAARYLRAAGAPAHLDQAILAYNHSTEYLTSVLLRAKLISAYPPGVIDTLTGLIDARLPVSGERLSWAPVASISSQSATANAHAITARPATLPPTPSTLTPTPSTPGSTLASPGSTPPPSPAAAAAAASGQGIDHPMQVVDLTSVPNASVVAVQDGRIVKLGSSRKLGSYVVLRDVYGDVFTYARLGSIARSYEPSPAQARRRASRGDRALPLRAGAMVSQGTVIGHVRTARGATDGHLLFAIRPAGDPNTIDPAPVLQNWVQLHAALHPQGTKGEPRLLGANAGARALGVARARLARLGLAHSTLTQSSAAHSWLARSAGSGPAAPSPLALGDELSAAQWNQLIARIAKLAVPTVPVKPSSAAIPDPQPVLRGRG
jgi:soluble lytic murein transglycosylase-like protein